MVRASAKYEPLAVEPGFEEPSSPTSPQQLSTRLVHSTFLRASITVIILCTILDLCLVLYITVFNSGSSAAIPEPLETLSTYMNLDELYAEKPYKTQHRPILNMPRNYFQVSSARPQTHFPYWTSATLTSDGNITSAEYRFVVTSKVSTISQFRAIDYGMEDCSLKLKTPEKNSTTVSLNIDGGNALVDIWQLSTSKALTGKLSWDSKPPRNKLIFTTNLSYGMDITLLDFRCVPGSFHTFEVACHHDTSCYVDGTWWKSPPLHIVQSQTLGRL